MLAFIKLTFIYVVVVNVNVSSSQSEGSLPKCCPRGKQLSIDGRSCVEFDYNDPNNSTEDVISVVLENGTAIYKLEHKAKFNCVRHETFVIGDDFFVTAENNVVVQDGLGNNWTLTTEELCVDNVYVPGIDRVSVALLCPDCQRVSCVHKCCPEGRRLVVTKGGSQVDCASYNETSWSSTFSENFADQPFVIHGFPDCPNKLYLEYPAGPMTVTTHGHLRLSRVTVARTEYCADLADEGSALLACRQVLLAASVKPVLYGGLFCLGSVFLAVTLGLHLWLPELRKTLHSRILVAHVACLLVSYLGLAMVNLVTIPAPSAVCSTTAFSIQFTILASIVWLNVMCVDIAWTFSGLRAPKASTSLDSDGHKFLYYSLYAWGSTAAISGVTAFLEYSPAVPATSRFKPSFGVTRCWFQHWESILLLVYGPMCLLLIANIVLFIYTAIKIQRTQRDTANIVQHAGSKLHQDRDRFSLYLKLFGLMGVTWVMEIVSWSVGGPESYWYITDAINALRSVFIFVLFCLKKKVYVLIKNKLSNKKGPKFPIHPRKSATSSKMTSSMTSQRTNSIQLSQVS